jgi:hypothetical protein
MKAFISCWADGGIWPGLLILRAFERREDS